MTENKQKRTTKQKRIVYEVLCSTNSHPAADWIYNEARKQIANISLSTVYRNLQMLCEDGLARELNYGKGQSRFDGNPQPHYHFVCSECGRVLDFDMPVEASCPEMFAYAPGVVSSHRLECYGTCNDCLCKKSMI